MRYKVYYQSQGKVNIQTFESLEDFRDIQNVIKVVDRKKNQNLFYFKKQLNIQDFLTFSKQLQSLLKAKISIGESLEMIIKSEKNEQLKELVKTLLHCVKNDASLQENLQPYKKVIPEDFIVFFELGINSGNIQESVDSIVKILEEKIQLKKKFQEILRYPLTLLVSLFSAFWMIFEFVLPNFQSILHSGQELTLSTQSLLYLNNMMENYSFLLLTGVFGVAYLGYFYRKQNRLLWDKILLVKIPLLSQVYKQYLYYKFFLALSIMVRSKYQMQTSLQNSIYLIENLYFQAVVEKILLEITNGKSIADAFESKELFDELTIKLLYTAQQSNEFDMILYDLTEYYHQNFEEQMKRFSSMIEPASVLFIALIVLWLVLGIMTPIWNMGSMIS
jgi:MSHA biogenesis protein MshG